MNNLLNFLVWLAVIGVFLYAAIEYKEEKPEVWGPRVYMGAK